MRRSMVWRGRELTNMGELMEAICKDVRTERDACEFIQDYRRVVSLETLISNLQYGFSRWSEVPKDRRRIQSLRAMFGKALL